MENETRMQITQFLITMWFKKGFHHVFCSMFGRSGILSHVACPQDAENGSCTRPYCPYKHTHNTGNNYDWYHSTSNNNAQNSASVVVQQEQADGMQPFMGYMGYIADGSPPSVSYVAQSLPGAEPKNVHVSPAKPDNNNTPIKTESKQQPAVKQSLEYTSPLRRKRGAQPKVEPPDLPIPKPSPSTSSTSAVQQQQQPSKKEKIVKPESQKQEKVKPEQSMKKNSKKRPKNEPVAVEPKKRKVEKSVVKKESKKPSKKAEPTSSKKPQTLNDKARELAKLDEQIAQLQKQMELQKQQRENLLSEEGGYDPSVVSTQTKVTIVKAPKKQKKVAEPQSSSSPTDVDDGFEYIPTPIAELKKKQEKEKVTSVNKQKYKPSKTSSAQLVDLFSVPTTSTSHDDSEQSFGDGNVLNDDDTTTILAAPEDSPTRPSVDVAEPEEEVPGAKKKRIAKSAGQTHDPVSLRASHTAAKGQMPSARQQMSMRYAQMQAEKQRIMEQANAHKVANEAVAPSNQHRANAVAATVPKGERRVAHLPSKLPENRPRITIEPGNASRIAIEVRQRYLDLFVEECVKTVSDTQQAYEMAVAEERALFDRATTKGGYISGAANTVKRLRQAAKDSDAKRSSALTISHSSVLGGKAVAEGKVSVAHKHVPPVDWHKIDDGTAYDLLLPYVLNHDELIANRFPYIDDSTGQCVITKEDKKRPILPDEDLDRYCVRCGAQFRLTEDGEYVSKDEECVYHWGKSWKRKVSGAWEHRYNCCQAELSRPGCCFAERHVSDSLRQSDLAHFVSTQHADKDTHKIYALDCEMVYSVWGSALARVSLVDRYCQPIIDELVRPDHELVDCNSRFSGIRPEDLMNAKFSFDEMRSLFLSYVTADTILIGHSLESDLRAMKIVHNMVVDTSVVFPHRLGAPHKRGLKTLMAEILRKIIQDDVHGHDSKEDAASCMELMVHKIKSDRAAVKK